MGFFKKRDEPPKQTTPEPPTPQRDELRAQTGQLSPNLMPVNNREVTPSPQSTMPQHQRGPMIEPQSFARATERLERNIEQAKESMRSKEQSQSREEFAKSISEYSKQNQPQRGQEKTRDRPPDR